MSVETTESEPAQSLCNRFIVHHGLPESSISDQGWNFENDLIAELCKLTKVQQLYTSPCHCLINWQCECSNHPLINMLGTLPPKKKSNWTDMVLTLVHVYNCTRSTAVGFSPLYLMYGQKSQLLISQYFGIQSADMNATVSMRFVQQLHERLRAYKTTQQVKERENKRHKQNFNHKVKCTQLCVGDLVLPKRMAFRDKHRIQDHWQKTIYWNLLLPFGSSMEDSKNEEHQQDVNGPSDCI